MLDQTVRHRIAAVAATLCFIPILISSIANGAFAQSGGGAGGGAGGGTGGSTGSSSGTTGTGGTVAPGGTAVSPATRTPSTGPQSRSPAMRPSPVPQANTGVPPVPSAGNAEPSSPIYRQDIKPGTAPQADNGNSVGTSSESRAPQMDAPIGGSGSRGAGDGSSGASDPLTPTDSAGNPALGESGPKPNSIAEEPNRIKRAGAAGKNLDECLNLWDPGTHMTKDRWKETCERLGR